ncbi:MAG: rhomboid family intramembrane serine protease [Candidatus Hadarchaeales archaeon]
MSIEFGYVEYKPSTVRFVFRRLERPIATYILTAAIIGVFILQIVTEVSLGENYFISGDRNSFLYYLCPSRRTLAERPWTLITSIFAHGGILHLLVNIIVFISFSPMLEMKIGKANFLAIFFLSGVIAALAQLSVSPPDVIVLGASGAILGLLGTLAVIMPRLPVLLFFFIPMRLWMFITGFGILSALMALTLPQSSVANLAHLIGIVVGVLAGIYVKRRRSRLYKRYVEYQDFMFGTW